MTPCAGLTKNKPCTRYFPIRGNAKLLRLEDPSNNNGRGWAVLSEKQLADLLYIGIKIAARSLRSGIADRNGTKADASARALARWLAARLKSYPIFGAAEGSPGPSCGRDGIGSNPNVDAGG